MERIAPPEAYASTGGASDRQGLGSVKNDDDDEREMSLKILRLRLKLLHLIELQKRGSYEKFLNLSFDGSCPCPVFREIWGHLSVGL